MGRSVEQFEWKPEASTGNRSQEQKEMGLIGPVAEPSVLPGVLLTRISFSGALNEAAKASGMEDWEIAEKIHISAGYMSRFMRTVGQQWAKRLVAFMRHTNSRAPLQWIAHQMGCEIVLKDSRAAELASLRTRIQELERAA